MKTKMIRRNGKLSLIDSTTEGGNPRLNSSVRPNKARDDDSRSNTHEGDLFNDMSDDDEGGTRVGDIYIPPPVAPYCSTESKGSRLIIKKIEVNNFKSFAGKVILGPFHHCFTAVIGPNGSGKSNVIDSMLFVFGYRANKIRCKKISALLHTSSIFPNVSSCSVAVHFCQIVDVKDNCCEEIPNSDIVVERTAFRDNSSFYTINGKRVQFKEVAALLKKHCVDLDHNRFLILQGEVETIAEMKPRGQTETECGMLEYLEDIVGTTRYKKPLVMINDRVETLTEERTEKHNRCKLAEREMNDLEQPYNEAVEYLKQENENTRTKNLRIQKYLSEKNKKLEQYVVEHDTINEELDKHDKESIELQKEREEKEDIIRKEIKHFENLRLKKEDIENKLEKANKGYVEVQQIMTKLNDSRKQNKTQLEKNEKDVEDLKNVPNRNKNEIKECEKKLEQLFKQKTKEEEELQRNYKELEKQTRPLIEQREKFETELIGLNGPVDEAKADLALSETELRILKEGETTETRKYETMKSSYEESQQTLKGKKSQLQKLQESLPEIEAQIVEKTKALQQLQVDENNLKTQLMIVKGEINEKISTMQTKRSNNKVLDLLMRQKNEGKIPGILGRLGDLGAIDDIYNVAISTACGRLDNIVVDTVNAAQECIEYLKRYDVGRASFIALEKVEHLKNQSGRFQVPENAARLYDLVRVEDERVLPAFYFALRNTLVAKDLETGTRIAYGARRHRVVTLNGDVIETSGTMSGGGRTQVRGKMGSKVQTKTTQSLNTSVAPQKALEELQIRAENIQSEINFKQEEQGRLERELQQMKSQALQTEMALQKLTITIKSYEDQLPRVFKQLEAQKKCKEQTTSDSEKVQITEMAIEKKKKTLMLAEEAANKVCKKIAQIKKQIGAFLECTVKTVQVKLKNTETEIKNLNNNIYKLNAGISGSERNVAKMTTEMERLRAEILEAQDKLKELSENREKHDNDIGEYTQQLNKIKEDIERAKSDSSDIHNDIQAIKKRENDLKLKRVEIEQKLQTVAAKMNEVKSQIPHWREQLKPLRLHDIPGEVKPKTPLKTYTVEELDAYSLQDIQYKESVQEELLKKKPNLSYIAEYIEKRDIYLQRVKVLEDVTCKRNEMRQLYDDVRKKRYNEFMQGFLTITRKLKEMYQMITQGGDAELELVDSMDPFTEGVSFSVRPPKKTWKNISNLSGGEKTLSSLALVFALHYYKPSPLYFMDEIDAALDFKNISIVAHYIKQRTKNAQFIVISLRSNMFELSDYLVGIYKVMESTDTCCIKNVKPRMPGNRTEIDLGTTTLQSQPAHLLPITECKENEVAEQPLAENVLIPNVTTNASIAADKGIANDPVEGSTCNRTVCSLNNISEAFNPQAESTFATPTVQEHVDQMSAKDGNANTLNNLFKKPLAPAKHS